MPRGCGPTSTSPRTSPVLGIELEQLADRHQRDVRGVAGGAHRDADGLGRVGQAKAALDDESIRVDDRDGVVVLVDDPELPFRRERQRLGLSVDRELGDLLQLVRVDRRDRVVVLVDGVDAVPGGVVDDRRRRGRPLRRQRVVDEVPEEGAAASPVASVAKTWTLYRPGAVKVWDIWAPPGWVVGLAELPLVREGAGRAGDAGRERVRLADHRRAGVRHVEREGERRRRRADPRHPTSDRAPGTARACSPRVGSV